MAQEELFTRPSEDRQMMLPDITSNFHKGNENSIEANNSLPPGVKSEIEKAIYKLICKLERVGCTCDEVEQSLELSHQTASSRMTVLKAERVIVQRYDGTPTDGRYKAKRMTRSGRRAGVFIARKFADGFESAQADLAAIRKDGEK